MAPMRTLLLLPAAAALVAGLVACDDARPAPPPVPTGPILGAAIDGSEDVPDEPTPAEPTPVEAAPDEPTPDEAAFDAGAADEVAAAEPEPVPEGPPEVSFWDLSLYELDVDAMLDALLYPEAYAEDELEELAFPEEIARHDGEEIVITGYMIPGEMVLGSVRDFMLVRDLLACCFGAQPMPDEWIAVTVHEDLDVEYFPYIPIRVTGTLTLGGEQDKAGFARGVYELLATDVREPD